MTDGRGPEPGRLPPFGTLRESRGTRVEGFCEQVREVVLLGSSSRGGSSMVAEILRASRGLVHLSAEFNPFLRLVGLGGPADGYDSDQLTADDVKRLDPELMRILDTELALDAGFPADEPADPRDFALTILWRLRLQWPRIPLDPRVWVPRIMELLAEETEPLDVAALHMRLLGRLRDSGHPVEARYYDLPGPAGSQTGRPAPAALTPPLLEEPPFVLSRPWRRATAEDLASKPLLIKTPSNAYRLGFVKALFPQARIRVLHLTRNPAASVNGLYDGWRHDGFHAHHVPEPLAIAGYSDLRADDRCWWKFDLPPGWQSYTGARLLEVCAFQWRAAHVHLLAGVAEHGFDYHRLAYENLIAGEASRVQQFEALCSWLRVDLDDRLRRVAVDGVPPIAATRTPRCNRWREREREIGEVLDGPTLELAERLGYDDEEQWL
ncbi:sulfotransferase [Streptomyces sp. NPDC059629]|uniref:sulfotransferase n=1 Tax=Streptomyces sp. NPDC059629 TaxID=3346889 RepID=UPI00367A3165